MNRSLCRFMIICFCNVWFIMNSLIACGTSRLPLDTISFVLTEKEWVSTDTALLAVDVNATLNHADLVRTRSDIMKQLNSIAKGDWHVTRFDRDQDSSGLERLIVQAEVRVLQSSLDNIYSDTKKLSRPGMTYSIHHVDFKPGSLDVQKARSSLRQHLYERVRDELTILNKNYPGQQYSVSKLILFDGDTPPPELMQRMPKAQNLAMVSAGASNVSVGSELVMSVFVEAGSVRDQNPEKKS